jgi:hypothetical protein
VSDKDLVAHLVLDLLRRLTKNLEHTIDVVFSGSSLDKHLFVEKLSDDATDGPHVNSRVIVALVVEV